MEQIKERNTAPGSLVRKWTASKRAGGYRQYCKKQANRWMRRQARYGDDAAKRVPYRGWSL